MKKKAGFFFIFLFSVQFIYSQYNIDYFLYIGRKCLIKSEFTRAIENFNIAVTHKPYLPEPYFLRGASKYYLGDYRGAILDFSQTLKLSPYFTDAYLYRGIAKDQLFDYKSALDDFNKAIDIEVYNSPVYLSRGITNLHLKEYEKALKDFNKAIRIDPSIQEIYLNRAIVNSILKNWEDAIADCNMVLKNNFLYADAFFIKAMIFHDMKNYEAAITNYNEAIKISSKNPRYYYNRALAKYKLPDYKGTIADYDKVLELDPENALTLYNRALLRSYVGDLNNAIKDLNKVIEINPNNILTYFNRGVMKAEIGDMKGTIGDYTNAIGLYPNFAQAYMNRGAAKIEIGDLRGAMKDQNTAALISKKNKEKGNDDIYTKTDSTYFSKIIEFKADFENKFDENKYVFGKIQNKDIDIDLKDNYTIEVKDIKWEEFQSSFFVRAIEEFNRDQYLPYKITLSSNPKNSDRVSPSSLKSTLNKSGIPKNKEAIHYFNLGMINYMDHNYNTAIDNFGLAIMQDPNFTLAYFARADVRHKIIEYIGTIQDVSVPIKVHGIDNQTIPESDDQKELVQYDAVIEDLNKTLKLSPNFALAYYNRGNIYSLSRDFKSAINDYSKAIKLEPELGEAYFNKGLILIYLKDKAGCKDLSKAGEKGIHEAYSVIKRFCH